MRKPDPRPPLSVPSPTEARIAEIAADLKRWNDAPGDAFLRWCGKSIPAHEVPGGEYFVCPDCGLHARIHIALEAASALSALQQLVEEVGTALAIETLGRRDAEQRLAAAERERATSRRACSCAEPDPVMQADDRFYCHACSFETGVRPKGLEPERWFREARATESTIASLKALTEEVQRVVEMSLAHDKGGQQVGPMFPGRMPPSMAKHFQKYLAALPASEGKP